MKLKSITFEQFYQSKTNSNRWVLQDFMLQDINLIVGKNATGKTRTLNILATLANLLSGVRNELPSDSVCFETRFDLNGQGARYDLCYKDKRVNKELYKIVVLDYNSSLEGEGEFLT